MKIRLSEQVARSMGYKTPAEKQAEKAHLEQQKAEQAATKKARREEQEREKVVIRVRSRQERDAAIRADTLLHESLEKLQAIERSTSAKQIDLAEQRCREAEQNRHKAREALQRATESYNRAEEASEEAREALDVLKARGYEVTSARDDLAKMWEVNQAAWSGVPTKFRKETRDRGLKNTVLEILKLTAEGDVP